MVELLKKSCLEAWWAFGESAAAKESLGTRNLYLNHTTLHSVNFLAHSVGGCGNYSTCQVYKVGVCLLKNEFSVS